MHFVMLGGNRRVVCLFDRDACRLQIAVFELQIAPQIHINHFVRDGLRGHLFAFQRALEDHRHVFLVEVVEGDFQLAGFRQDDGVEHRAVVLAHFRDALFYFGF